MGIGASFFHDVHKKQQQRQQQQHENQHNVEALRGENGRDDADAVDGRKNEDKKERAKKKVLVPPTFGVGTDVVLPPSARTDSSSSMRSSLPFSSPPSSLCWNYMNFVGGTDGESVVIKGILQSMPCMRLLSHEHLLTGLWISASTHTGDGNALASYHQQPNLQQRTRGRRAAGTTGEVTSGRTVAGVGTLAMSKLFTPSSLSSVDIGIGLAANSYYASSPNSNLDVVAFVSNPQLGLTAFASYKNNDGNNEQGTVGWNYYSTLLSQTSPQQSTITREQQQDHHANDNIEYWRNAPIDTRSTFKNKQQDREVNEEDGHPIHVNVGSSLQLSSRENSPAAGKSPQPTALRSHCAMFLPQWNNCAAAIEMNVPLFTPSDALSSDLSRSLFSEDGVLKRLNPNISCLLSFDLNANNNNNGNGKTTQLKGAGGGGPPIVVTFHKTHCGSNTTSNRNHFHYQGGQESNMTTTTTTAATVSQTLTFDRYVTNVLETRSPFIRNTLCWSVQMSQNTRTGITTPTATGATTRIVNDDCASVASTMSSTTESGMVPPPMTATTTTTALKAAIAWQMNRGLCYKVHACTQEGITAAIILKRWKHPRVTCSLLFGTTTAGQGGGGSGLFYGGGNMFGVGFKGVCVQIETGPLASSSSLGCDYTKRQSTRFNGKGRKRKGRAYYNNKDWLYGTKQSETDEEDTPITRVELSSLFPLQK